MDYVNIKDIRRNYIRELKALVEALEKENEKLYPDFAKLCLKVEVCATSIENVGLLRGSCLDKM